MMSPGLQGALLEAEVAAVELFLGQAVGGIHRAVLVD
jgi:hypothetical protein